MLFYVNYYNYPNCQGITFFPLKKNYVIEIPKGQKNATHVLISYTYIIHIH